MSDSFDSSVGANEWLEVVSEVNTTISSLQDIHSQLHSLNQQVEKGGHWKESAGFVSSVSDLVEQVKELEHLYSYLTWLSHINTLRLVVQSVVS